MSGNESLEFDALYIERLFLSSCNLNKFEWDDLINTFDCEYEKSQENQNKLLEITVNHPLVKKYPLKVSYQLYFLKQFLKKLEKKGVEVSEQLYQKYVELLQEDANEGTENYHYKHYRLPNDDYVTLSEKSSIISHGTTGLCSWQGALALTDWLWKNKSLVEGKFILELGSGIGLAGLSLLSFCQPSHYFFSDCHPEVLNQLLTNVRLNLNKSGNCKESHSQATKDSNWIFWETEYSNIGVKILDLPWEVVAEKQPAIRPDIILASDVVYDSSLFEPLISALEYFLKCGTNYAILMCTVRNEITLGNFIDIAGTRHLELAELPATKSYASHSSLDVPVKAFKISYLI